MKKEIISFPLLTTLLLTSCTSLFSKNDYEYLSDQNNYHKYQVKFNSYNNSSNATIYVTFLSLEKLQSFQTTPLLDEEKIDYYPIPFIIVKDNNSILETNNFFLDISVGDIFEIYACNYSTSNSRYTFICSIDYNQKTYLSKEEGMQGIINHLDNNKSPFF